MNGGFAPLAMHQTPTTGQNAAIAMKLWNRRRREL